MATLFPRDSAELKEAEDTGEIKEVKEEETKILKKLKDLNQDPKNFLLTEDFAIYKGNNVDYRHIRKEFPKIVASKVNVKGKEAVLEAKKIAIFLNLGGFSGTRKNIVSVKDTPYTLDELTNKLDLTNFSKTSAKTTDRKFVTLTRVCIAYADDTREAIRKKPIISRFPELSDLGFVYSWACSDLKEEEIKRIYVKLLDLVQNWTPSRTSNPKRFPEKMEIYYTTVLGFSRIFFSKIREDYASGNIKFL